MKILFIVNYYSPYVSGVTEYLRLLAEDLAGKGHDITVLASNHAKLMEKEIINGVKVVRAPIICKISKGTVSVQFITWARKLSKNADIVNLHLPMLESGLITSIIDRKKIFITYQCDINLPKSIINNFIVKVMDASHKIALKKARQIIVLTTEYAQKSRVASLFMDKVIEISPPIKKMYAVEMKTLKRKKVIGFCGRIVEEKGISVLLEAYLELKKERTDIELIIGGDYENIAGGSIYPHLLDFISRENIEDVHFVGKIPEEKMSEFYSSLDVLVLPSINSLEAFGMVQVEAMLCGTPVVSSDLLGVRTIVQKTGMGLISKRGDKLSLEKCIGEILDNPEKFIKSYQFINSVYSTEQTSEQYIKYFKEVVTTNKI